MADRTGEWGPEYGVAGAVLTDDGIILHHIPEYLPGDGPLFRMACGVEEQAVIFEWGAEMPEDAGVAACDRCFACFDEDAGTLKIPGGLVIKLSDDEEGRP